MTEGLRPCWRKGPKDPMGRWAQEGPGRGFESGIDADLRSKSGDAALQGRQPTTTAPSIKFGVAPDRLSMSKQGTETLYLNFSFTITLILFLFFFIKLAPSLDLRLRCNLLGFF